MLRQLYLIFLLFCLTFTLTWAEDSGKKVKGRVCDENNLLSVQMYIGKEPKMEPRPMWMEISS